MDDSDQDFVDLCSKLLKRVRKKPGEPRQARKAEQQPSSQASDGDKKRRNNSKRDGDGGSKCAGTQPGAEPKEPVVCGRTGCDSGDAGSSGVSAAAAAAAAAAGPKAERVLRAKDKVLDRMQQFKRASPQRMVRKDKSQTTDHERDCAAPPPLLQRHDSFSSGLHPEPQDSDEALALQLQQELDREAAGVPTVDLEDGGLFFCQICHKDLSHMTPEGRTQHLNRCLDESEESAPAPPPPPPGVPDCPICGKKFKSQKSRSTHLKRCSADMGVSPAVLLQALQRQSEETQNVPAANTAETGGTKRKGPSRPGGQARKKPRKKAEPMDEDTMVALALSTSLLNQERESEGWLQTETVASDIASTPVLKWRPEAGKGRGKRKKGTVPRPPPLLLIQDAEAALTRLQERVSALLLRGRPSSPPTPTRCPSSLPGWKGAAPLWQMSALLHGGSTCLSDFYTPELREFITPWESATIDAASSNDVSKPESSVQPTGEGTPVAVARASILPSTSQTAASSPAPSTPGTGQLPVSSQTLRDLMELAEDGMTMTQCGYTASGPDKDKSACPTTNLQVSGFLVEESEEQADLCVNGFLPETTHAGDSKDRARRTTCQPGADKNRGQSVALSRLSSDLGSMVNNPQLSDVQLQVDSGEVYFAHSFMALARCPLLAEMVHESGFGVREEGMPAAQRVLISDVPGQAVFALLQYIYTAHCSIPGSLRPHVLELASRFDLQELQQLCELHQDAATLGDEEDYANVNNQTDQAFVELLRSMWNEEDEDNEGADTDEGRDEEKGSKEDHPADDLTAAEREIGEEKVNEEELEEIYEFAATQKKREGEKDSMDEEEEEEVVDEEDDAEEVFTKPSEPKRSSTGFSNKNLQPNSLIEQDPSLDRSYSRLFSDSWGVYEEGDPSSLPSTSGQPKTHAPQSQKHQSLHKSSLERSGRTLLQSSASVVHDLSLSPPPNTSNLPIPGQSPGQVGDWGADAADLDEPKESLHLKRESQGPRSICVPLSPDSPQIKKEPELIVLSDSSEEMGLVLSSRSPSPPSPHVVQKQQSYTQIMPQPTLEPDEPPQDNKRFRSLEFSPDDRCAAANCRGQSPLDCSPEVSWLIPSTPLQHRRSVTSSSTQTKSSICRTQLFPKGDSSSLSVFSPPALPYRPQTSESPTRVSAHSGPTEGSAPRLKHPCSSSFEPHLSPGVSKVKKEFAAPPSQFKRAHLSSSFPSMQDTPLHLQPHPYSSTPLHTEIQQPHNLLDTSPLRSSLDKQTSASQGKESASSDSPNKTELGSFHLSPLSDPSGPPSSSSHGVLQSSQRHSDYPHQSPESKMSGIKDEEGEMECQNKDRGDDGEQEEVKAESGVAEVAEPSFQQSFLAMDEPPIAFNDSWGLDACVDANPGCFSLKLEESRGSSLQEHSPAQQKTTRSSSSSDCQPSPSTHRLLNGHGKGVMTHSSQPRTSERAQTGPSLTPSPPDPATRTTPQISSSLLDSKIWDSWEDEEEEEAPPLSERLNPAAHFRTPASSHNKRRRTLVPITPMPHYSDMDTPELKNKLNRFGVRPLPKRQMILKLKEIHQYTHQLTSSDSEDEGCVSAGRAAPMKPPPASSVAAGSRPLSSAQTVKFKEPLALAATSPLKRNREEEAELLSASQGSNTSSTAASEESERSNPELCVTSDSDSDDSDITASQVATRLQDRLQAVRSFILSDSGLYSQILQYQPLVLSQLQQQLKAAGIRLGAAKLMDYLDSQCITFTTAKPGQSAPSRRRGKKSGKVAKAAGDSGASRKRASLHNKRCHSLVPITPMIPYSDKDTLELKNQLSRSNPELCLSSDSDSDSSDISTSTRLQDRLQALRSFILSDSGLYTKILQYQPLVLSQLQQQLKAAGIPLGAAKLMDYLDSQCITFTTVKPGQSAPSRRRGNGAKAAGDSETSRAPMKPPPTSSVAAGNRPLSSAQTVKFKEPLTLAATSPLKHNREEEAELLSASQGSNTSSTAASEETERSNSELCSCTTAASDSDSGINIPQWSTHLQDRLQAVRSFILSDSTLYTQILQYQPLVLSQLQQQLKAAGIRLGAAKLMDYLDSQCITFTTAEPGHTAPSSLASCLGGQEDTQGGKGSARLHRKVADLFD